MVRSASREPVVGDEALGVLAGVKDLCVAQGKKVRQVDLVSARPADDELLELLLGRSGKLRAPAIRKGTTLLVGYHPDFLTRVLT